MAGLVELSIIIVTHNVADLIANCLQSVFRECGGIKAEVVVVDSGSADRTVATVQESFPEVKLYASPRNIGFSAANNLALAECTGRYIMLLNPDTIVKPGALRRLIFHLEQHPQVGAVGPRLLLGDGRIQPECARNLPKLRNMLPWLLLLDKLEWKIRYRGNCVESRSHPPAGGIFDNFLLLFWDRTQSCEVECIAGACMLLRAEVVCQIGLLDEAAPLYLDDIDYCRRIRGAGWSIHYVSEADIVHLWKQSSLPLRRTGDLYAMVCHSIWLYIRKHEGRWSASLFSVEVGVACLIRLPLSIVGRWLPGDSRRRFWRYQLEMVLGLCRWLARFPKIAPDFGFANEANTFHARAPRYIA